MGTVLVEGPAGIGKSRTVEEFRAAVQQEGGEVLVGRCVSLGEEIFPYAPAAELLRDLVARVGADAVTRLGGSASPASPTGSCSAPAGEGPEAPEATAGERRPPVPGLLLAVRRDQPLNRPVVLVIEDVHWADRSTRALLSLLAHQLRGGALLLLTLRTDEAPKDPGRPPG